MTQGYNKKHAIDVLRNRYLEDFQRQNLFEIDIKLENVSNKSQYFDNALTLTKDLIQGVNLPSSILSTIEIKRHGRRIFVPGEYRNSEEINLTLIADVEGRVKDFFHSWQAAYYLGINNPSHLNRGKYINMATVDIFTLDSKHNRRTKTTMYNAFPRSIGEITLDNTSENTITTFQVIIAFSNAKFIGGN